MQGGEGGKGEGTDSDSDFRTMPFVVRQWKLNPLLHILCKSHSGATVSYGRSLVGRRPSLLLHERYMC